MDTRSCPEAGQWPVRIQVSVSKAPQAALQDGQRLCPVATCTAPLTNEKTSKGSPPTTWPGLTVSLLTDAYRAPFALPISAPAPLTLVPFSSPLHLLIQ